VSLADWLNDGWLVKHESSAEEIAALLAIVERDLANATLAGLSEDWKLNIAYNAALQAATAALAAAGYRAARGRARVAARTPSAAVVGVSD